ncbi:p10 [Ectropis obliqua nucleopolyhedrovirus]|uniref:p10 n=1 Tax=Ectropis obliqua nucleopolyhedrovirus TaxID=59376 RepID=A0EYS2_9ABAC|nr:p10 [Ectropis obliqua nucleopolyhedrovirus]ABI35703.1 p10 [Ectropis obliqua nucleopolyhedrovirus]AGS47883.1 protein p10 [Ectropis obliqua nucleopolyhedrovirus]QWV59605.1 p10 [Ectropis obliqua nucleopolyhedrovirus]UYO72811.1 p10 [Ectropis obliqua nucleopolyhedrovirus]
MSQNILLVIRADIKALDDKVTALQQQVEDVRTNLPDTTELNTKLDAQAQSLDTISTTVNDIHNTLNPDLPEIPILPVVPGLRVKAKK